MIKQDFNLKASLGLTADAVEETVNLTVSTAASIVEGIVRVVVAPIARGLFGALPLWGWGLLAGVGLIYVSPLLRLIPRRKT